MTYKSDVAEKLLDWKQEAELESGENLIKIRSDGAPEFKKIVKAMGIIHELSTADTPEQNAKAERLNRTIVTKARSMLAGAALPKRL